MGKDGLILRPREGTRFYCYILADLTGNMTEFAIHAGLQLTPDGDAYYGVTPILNCYTEVIGYKKVLDDSKKRNLGGFSAHGGRV
jgi:hypothetical protein